MANICNYKMRIKGSKKACQLIAATTPCADYKDIHFLRLGDDESIIEVVGDCKWSVTSSFVRLRGTVPSDFSLDQIPDVEDDDIEYILDETLMNAFWNISIVEKSRILDCEVEIYSVCKDDDLAEHLHCKSGKVIKSEERCYILFRWDKNEYEDFSDWEEYYDIAEMYEQGLEHLYEEDFSDDDGDGIFTYEYGGFTEEFSFGDDKVKDRRNDFEKICYQLGKNKLILVAQKLLGADSFPANKWDSYDDEEAVRSIYGYLLMHLPDVIDGIFDMDMSQVADIIRKTAVELGLL